MIEKAIGLIELSSVAAGFQVADTMLKAGNVRLILSRSICSGKYMVLIGGPGPTPWLYDDRLRLNGLRISFAPPPPAPNGSCRWRA